MGHIRGIFVTGARVFSSLLYAVGTGTIAVYLLMAMSNQSQPHMEITSSHLEGGESPSTGNGNPAPATGHGTRLVGNSGRVAHYTRCPRQTAEVSQATIGIIFLRDMGPVWERVLGPEGTCLPPHLIAEVDQGMRGNAMETMAGRETGKGFLRRALPVATWFLCLGTDLGVPSQMIGLLGPIIQLGTAISSDDSTTLTMVTFLGVMCALPGHANPKLGTGPQDQICLALTLCLRTC